MCARVCIQGVLEYGIVDTGADITIIGGEKGGCSGKAEEQEYSSIAGQSTGAYNACSTATNHMRTTSPEYVPWWQWKLTSSITEAR